MSEKLFYIKHPYLSCIGINNDEIIISSNKHETFSSLKDEALNKKGFVSIFVIERNSIIKLETNTKNIEAKIVYTSKNKRKKKTIPFEEIKTLNEFIEIITPSNVNAKTTEKLDYALLTKKIGYSPLLLMFFWALNNIATDIEIGKDIEISGRRQGYQKMGVLLAENIGSQGVKIAFLAFIIIMTIRISKVFKNKLEINEYNIE